jgi:type II secretory pathway pseudopilin PulG
MRLMAPVSRTGRHPSVVSRQLERRRRLTRADDAGYSLVELLVAFSLLVLLTAVLATALTTYLQAGTTVISTYNSTDQLLPSSIVIQRLIRSEVEPAPTPTTSMGATACAAVSAPCPPFLTGNSIGTYSTTFFANVGDANGPAKIVMSEATPTCTGCKFYTSVFTVDQYAACSTTTQLAGCPAFHGYAGCPFSVTSTLTCSWTNTPKVLVDIPNVVNGAAPVAPAVIVNGVSTTTPLPYSSTNIFTYNTLDPYSSNYVPSATSFSSCAAPTTNGNGDPTSSNCPADNIQSVGVDLEVQTPGSPAQENAFTVYRLSSASYLYSPLVG